MKLSFLIALTLFGLAFAFPAPAQSETRYATLASDEVNMRTGPGLRYPIEWVLLKKGAPVEIVNEFNHWRKIRDVNGDEGWVHRAMLSGKRNVWINVSAQALYEQPAENARVVAMFDEGVIASLIACPASEWCHIKALAYEGWVPRSSLWGIGAHELID